MTYSTLAAVIHVRLIEMAPWTASVWWRCLPSPQLSARFKLRIAALQEKVTRSVIISRQTLDKDFQRNTACHRTWLHQPSLKRLIDLSAS